MLLMCALWAAAATTDLGLLNSLSDYPHARCLDGSPAIYYFRPGSGSSVDKFFFFRMGGGFCTSVEDCYDRAIDCEAGLGSSKCWDKQLNLTGEHPYFSPVSSRNPLLHNWNVVYMVYCDGAYFSGYNSSATIYNQTRLYFAGRHILEATIAHVRSHHNLRRAKAAVVGGCSAGAIATYAHLDWMADLLREASGVPALRVVGFPDSGYYMDVDFFTRQKAFVVAYQNVTSMLNAQCVKDFATLPHKCLVADINAQYIHTPLFAWQSEFDKDQLTSSLPVPCHESACAEPYAANMSFSMTRTLWRGEGARIGHGGFLDSCYRHCETPALRVAPVGGFTPLQALHAWYENNGSSVSSVVVKQPHDKFPCTSCCTGN